MDTINWLDTEVDVLTERCPVGIMLLRGKDRRGVLQVRVSYNAQRGHCNPTAIMPVNDIVTTVSAKSRRLGGESCISILLLSCCWKCHIRLLLFRLPVRAYGPGFQS